MIALDERIDSAETGEFPVPFGELEPAEREEFRRCVDIIERSLKTFIEVGDALMRIRERRFYRESHSSFEGFCSERWGMSKTQANRLIAATEVVANLTPIGANPIAESQVRPLSGLSPDQQREAWRRAVESAPEGKVTAAHVEAAAKEIRGEESPPPDEGWSLIFAMGYLISKTYAISIQWPREHLEVMAYKLHDLGDELLKYGELRE